MKLRALILATALICFAALCPALAGAATSSWQLEPASFDFGVRLPGEGPTAPQAFELRNTGETTLTPEFVAVVDRVGRGFALAGNDCNRALAPSTVCTIKVAFDPGTGGKKEATLTVETASSPVVAATAQLLGSGGEPIASVDPPAVVFDPVVIPTASLPAGSRRTITITNIGSADMKVQGLGYQEAAASSPATPNFAVLGNSIGPGLCVRATLPPGGSCTLNLSFTPGAPGDYRAELTLEYTDLEEEARRVARQVIPLSGTAVAQAAPVPPPKPAPAAASLPRLLRRPALRTTSRVATFVFAVDSAPGGIQCRSTRKSRFQACTSPTHLLHLEPGAQFFSVRAIGADGTPGPVTTYRWRVLPPKPTKPKPKPPRR